MTSPAPEPGWFPDPWDARRERYWDGAEWAAQWRVRGSQPQQPTPSVRPVPAAPPTRKAGWYPDPSDNEQEVYWDGSGWHGRRAVDPEYTPPTSNPGPTDGVRQWWSGLTAVDRRVIIIVAAAVVAVGTVLSMIFGLINTDSPIEKDCKATAHANGYTGSEADTFVKFCVHNAQ